MAPQQDPKNSSADPQSAAKMAALKKGLSCGKLILKLASSEQELLETFKLRHTVFYKELGEGLPNGVLSGLDKDNYDQVCDHLLVISEGRIIGTYRLLFGPNRGDLGFYTQGEFNLSGLGFDMSQAVELGRGCIDPVHRKQTTLMALFWGLHKYMAMRKARYLLGCASLPKMSGHDALATYDKLLKDGNVDHLKGVNPLDSYITHGDPNLGNPNIPPLIKLYLQFGARILALPADDKAFGCHDLLMAFDMDHLTPWGLDLLDRFDRRLLVASSGQG